MFKPIWLWKPDYLQVRGLWTRRGHLESYYQFSVLAGDHLGWPEDCSVVVRWWPVAEIPLYSSKTHLACALGGCRWAWLPGPGQRKLVLWCLQGRTLGVRHKKLSPFPVPFYSNSASPSQSRRSRPSVLPSEDPSGRWGWNFLTTMHPCWMLGSREGFRSRIHTVSLFLKMFISTGLPYIILPSWWIGAYTCLHLPPLNFPFTLPFQVLSHVLRPNESISLLESFSTRHTPSNVCAKINASLGKCGQIEKELFFFPPLQSLLLICWWVSFWSLIL